jgi:hypothetical protein
LRTDPELAGTDLVVTSATVGVEFEGETAGGVSSAVVFVVALLVDFEETFLVIATEAFLAVSAAALASATVTRD